MSDKSILGIADIGFDTIILEKEKPKEEEVTVVVETVQIEKHNCVNEDSIQDTVDIGFGEQNVIIKECPGFKIPLCKENYLGEFETPIEKALARKNLEVYSKEEIDNAISKVLSNELSDLSNFITKSEVQKIINSLSFVDSNLKAYVDCKIPDNLFKK